MQYIFTLLKKIIRYVFIHFKVISISTSSIFRMFALQRMKEAGAHLTTSESAILGLCGGSDHPNFREIQKIIWDAAPDSGLLGHTVRGETPV